LAVYNKAIRDKIPEIIKNSGNDCNVKKLSDEEFLAKLEEKLQEEVQEYKESKSPEELADILEVIFRVAELKGMTKNQLEQLRERKSQERGGFKDNLFLIDTTKSD
jgi:predicted house-cleaning noncanonical NTP pyrophosphatase (MazG superfamily)